MIVFTVQVEAMSKKDFTADGIRMFHQECGGGSITRSGDADWKLYCERCHLEVWVARTVDGNAALALTATDGDTRQIEARYPHMYEIIATRRKHS
jgi:hypothetical protein